jgi:lysozyme
MDLDKLREQLILHESVKLLPYDDKTGGEVKPGHVLQGYFTIGIGHNLTINGISITISDLLFAEDVAKTTKAVLKLFPWWTALGDVRQRVVIDMVFNIGITGFSKFHETIKAIEKGDFHRAADQMEKSLWYKQVGTRAVRLTKMMRTGLDPIELL